MTKISTLATATAVVSLLVMGTAFAQTPAPAPAPAKSDSATTAKTRPAKTETMSPAEKQARTAISLECSKQADEKKLRGKERKKFRSACKKEAAEKAGATKAN
jgi:hypothetical protein